MTFKALCDRVSAKFVSYNSLPFSPGFRLIVLLTPGTLSPFKPLDFGLCFLCLEKFLPTSLFGWLILSL